jgi:pimeloyl-ACP methyl ester carboxylesterase
MPLPAYVKWTLHITNAPCNKKEEFAMKVRNIALGALLAAALIAPSLAHADPVLFPGESTVATRDRLSDEIVGHGPDIVFIPGLASSRETWRSQAMQLKDHYRVHLINLAGFAGEPSRANAKGDVFVPTAEALDAYLVEQHLAPATLIGHSLGGTMLLYLAEKHPADIKKGFIVDALPFYGVLMGGPTATSESLKPIADSIRANPQKMFDEPRYSQMLKSMVSSDDHQALIRTWGKASDPGVSVNAMADDMTLDLRPGLGAITTPLTLIYPDYAPAGSPKGVSDMMYRGAYASDKTMSFVLATDSLHFIMFDQPAQLDAALDKFLAN